MRSWFSLGVTDVAGCNTVDGVQRHAQTSPPLSYSLSLAHRTLSIHDCALSCCEGLVPAVLLTLSVCGTLLASTKLFLTCPQLLLLRACECVAWVGA